MNKDLLKLLSQNARLSNEELSVMTGQSENEIHSEIADMESGGIIRGYKTVVDWERIDNSSVSALIELKVTPKAGLGFEEVAMKVSKYPQVESVYLMSGGFDLAITVECPTMREVAFFVAEKLATIEGVTATATHFELQKYKENGVVYGTEKTDKRGNSW